MSGWGWAALVGYFVLMVLVGIYAVKRVRGSADYFVAGGKLPWWLSGVSHHVSGYSGVVFSAYAAIAYTYGVTIYMWWAVAITISVIVGAYLIAPRWARLRMKVNVESPLEYLAIRYNVPTQQVIAWSGILLKLLDTGAKWTALAILLNGFTGIPIPIGVFIAGGASLVYITIGGLWADVLNDFAQFVVQTLAAALIFVGVLWQLGGVSALWTMWDRLPPEHSQLFREPYTFGFFLAYIFITFFSYNGGTWNLAARYMASPSGPEARRAAILSGVLYLTWPLVLFAPMWASPLIFPELDNPEQLYTVLAQQFLHPALVGLVLAGMFAATMSMTSGDINTISAVIVRDILPTLFKKMRGIDQRQSLKLARITTLVFTVLTLIIGVYADAFGGVLGLVISWFGALVGPVSIPMILGLLPAFRYSDSVAAIGSIVAGLVAFVVVKYGVPDASQTMNVAAPILVSFVAYVGFGLLNRGKVVPEQVNRLLSLLDDDVVDSRLTPISGEHSV